MLFLRNYLKKLGIFAIDNLDDNSLTQIMEFLRNEPDKFEKFIVFLDNKFDP